MFKTGTPIEIIKGYEGIKGVVVGRTDSRFELYVLKLDNGLSLIAGPTAFIPPEMESYKEFTHE